MKNVKEKQSFKGKIVAHVGRTVYKSYTLYLTLSVRAAPSQFLTSPTVNSCRSLLKESIHCTWYAVS